MDRRLVVSPRFVAMMFRGVLMRLALPVVGQDRCLLMCGRRPQMRAPRLQVSLGGRLVGVVGTSECLLGAPFCVLDILGRRRQAPRQFVATPS